MPVVKVGLGARSYDIVIEQGVLADPGRHLVPLFGNRRAVIVTDGNVARHVLPGFLSALTAAGIPCESVTVPAGEEAKSWNGLAALCDRLLALDVERSDHLIALGGGVIGDLTGFAAAILKRGCHFIQVPTTLLAQVDSSVGGKTAINASAGKNLIGAFHQPALVLIDPATLGTLPDREMRAGYAEIAKYGLLGDADFFDWCEANADAVLARAQIALAHAIETSVRAKAAIVEADERETADKRALLNLGHTFGHALEAETGFSDRLLHGEAVAAGIALAFGFSAHCELCPRPDADRVWNHFLKLGYDLDPVQASGEALVAHMLHDKKKSGGTLPFILAYGIGQAFVDRTVDLSRVAAFLNARAAI